MDNHTIARDRSPSAPPTPHEPTGTSEVPIAPATGSQDTTGELFQQFVHNTPAAVAMFDREMRYLLTSKRWLTDYLLTDQNIIGRSHYDVFPDLKESWKEIHRLGMTGAVERCDEDLWRRADGSTVWIRWEMQPWRTPSGSIGGIVLFTEVITQQKRDQEHILQLNAELQQRVRERTAALESATREARSAELALADTERRLRQIADQTTDAIYAFDHARRLIYVNPALEKVTGYTPADLRERGFINWAHPDDAERVRQLWESLFDGAGHGTIEYRLITKSGAIKWCHSTWGPLYDDAGCWIGVQGRDHDITERKHAELTLRESEANLRALFDSSHQAVILIDREHNIRAWNRLASDAVRHVVGKELRAGVSVYQFMLSRHTAAFTARFQAALAGEPQTIEQPFRVGDDINWWEMHFSPIAMPDGEITGVAIISRDVTAQRLAKEALDRSERKFGNLIQSINAIVWEADGGSFQFTFVSEQAESILGYPVADWLNIPNFWADHIYADDRQEAIHYCVESTRARQNHEFEYRMVAADGRVVWLHDLVTVEVRDAGAVVLRGVMFDITERKRLEAQLLQSQKMESVGRLAGGLAHDFNNLLTAISGYASLAMADLAPGSATYGDLDEILRAVQRAARLTRQLLAFARRNVVELRVLNLNELVLNLDKLLRRLIGEDIELVVLPAPALALVKADPGQIEQVLVNLAVNARDAMTHGGKLTIATQCVVVEHAHGWGDGSLAAGPYVRLSVSDTGAGMSDEVKAHVFEPFYTTKASTHGTGLGLAICYGIVTQARGQIELESAPGHGTTVHIYLPQIDDLAQSAAPGDAGDSSPIGYETVLLAEDEPAVRALGARILRRHGYTVLEAANGIDALRVAQEQAGRPIDLLLTDIVMPQMGGEALAEQFRAAYPGARVLFTSGYADSASFRSNVIDQGAPFIEKPFLPEALARKVREVLDG